MLMDLFFWLLQLRRKEEDDKESEGGEERKSVDGIQGKQLLRMSAVTRRGVSTFGDGVSP
jgi:hypothetical protein